MEFLNKKAGSVVHIGAPLALIVLVVLFVIISLLSPPLAAKIAGILSNLKQAILG